MASHANTARAYSGAGRLEEAADTYREVIAIFREEYGNENFYIAGLLQSYGSVFIRMEEYEQAETVILEALQHSERLLPEGHLRHAFPLLGLGNALMGQEAYDEALAYIEQAFDIRNGQLPEDDALLNSTRHALGRCLWELGRSDEAEPHLSQALAYYNNDPERNREKIEEIRALGYQE
jgi:tetratricopeptide (TPR) repeat protein